MTALSGDGTGHPNSMLSPPSPKHKVVLLYLLVKISWENTPTHIWTFFLHQWPPHFSIRRWIEFHPYSLHNSYSSSWVWWWSNILSSPCSTTISHLPGNLLSSRLIWLRSYFPFAKNPQVFTHDHKYCFCKLCYYTSTWVKQCFLICPEVEKLLFSSFLLRSGRFTLSLLNYFLHTLSSNSFSLWHTEL